MSRLNEREIARKLAEREELGAPAGLLDKIKNEIPESLPAGAPVPENGRRSPMPMTQRWLIAASLIASIGAGLFALRVREVTPPPMPAAASREASPAAPPPAQAVPAPRPQAEPPARQVAPAPSPRAKKAPVSREEKGEMKALGHLGRSDSPVNRPSEVAGGVSGGVVGGIAGGVPAGVPSPALPPPPPPPVMDERRISSGATVSQEELAKIPAARDPWAVVQNTPGAKADRINVGGNESGDQAVWSVDGTAITDMKALGSSPTYYDFDDFKEMQATPGGAKEKPPAKPNAYFKSAAVNPFVETAKDKLSTFGLDVDTASYTVARQYLTSGQMPVPASVRVEEFVNFFDYGDAPPAHGDFAIKAEGAPTPFTQGPQYRLLRFNLRGREVRMDNRRPVVLTFLIDVSGSMDAPNRLGLVKQALSLLLDQLRPTDRIGLVVFGTNARVLLEPTSDREAVRRAIGQLVPEGATNLEEGLAVAYAMADRSFRPNASSRIILCSDGGANVGHAGPQAILGQIGREARRGIELTTLGFGMGDYNDNLMEQLADKGDGRNAYIDTLDEAKRVLVEEVSGTLNTIAKDAKVQVEFNPAAVARYRLIGYENRAIADERFRDNRVIAGQIGSGHSVTALYEIELRPGAPKDGVAATLRLRYRSPEIGNLTETEKRLYLSELAPAWEKASPGFRLAALVAQFAEILKGSPWAKGSLADVAQQIQAAAKALPKSTANARFSELADLAGKAARIKGASAGSAP